MNPHSQSLVLPTRDDVAGLAREAAALTLTYFRRALDVREKEGDQGLVTEADLASERLLREAIGKRFPRHVVLGEEAGWGGLPEGTTLDSEGRPRREQGAGPLGVWIVDPIDGTTNFSNGNPFYCVSVGFGVLEGSSLRLRAGAIAHPVTGDVYTAVRGEGAQVNGTPIRVNPNADFRRASFATGFSSNKGAKLGRIGAAIAAIQDASIGLRINGAAALDLAFTARGILHGFFESSLKPWDLAAGVLLVEEAGGKVTNYAGAPFDPLADADVVCAGPALHGPLLEKVEALLA